MGVKDFLPLLYNEKYNFVDNSIRPTTLIAESIRNCTLGVDASGWMHMMCSAVDFARAFHQKPPLNLQFLVDQWFNRAYKALKTLNIDMLLVFDGHHHPLKKNTDAGRRDAITFYEEKIRNICSECFNDEEETNVHQIGRTVDWGTKRLAELDLLMKKSCYPREDIIQNVLVWAKKKGVQCIGAPFEADWQLVELEKSGIINGIITVDSDLLVLGGRLVIMDLNLFSGTFSCRVYRRDIWMEQILNMDETQVLNLVSLLGTDYLDNIKGIGLLGVLKIIEFWNNSINLSIDDIIESIKKKEIENLQSLKADFDKAKYINAFHKNQNIFLYAPVFRISSLDESDMTTARDALVSNNFKVELISLTELPPNMDWSAAISMNEVFDPKTHLTQGYETPMNTSDLSTEELESFYKDCYLMEKWSRVGKAPAPATVISLPGRLPGFELDFIHKPIHLYSLSQLTAWLSAHSIIMRAQDIQRDKVIPKVKNYIASGTIPPLMTEATLDDFQGHGHYVSWDKLFPLSGDDRFQWEKYDVHFFNLLKSFKVTRPINDEYIDSIFGLRKNGVRYRATRAVQSGHYNLNTLLYTDAEIDEVVEEEQEDPEAAPVLTTRRTEVYVISVVCTPSMKMEDYTIYLIFNKQTFEYLGTPTSRCGCPAGRLFCSHMLGLMLILHTIQFTDALTPELLLVLLPEPVKTIQALPISANYVFGGNKFMAKTSTVKDRQRRK